MELKEIASPGAHSGFISCTNCLGSFTYSPQPMFLLQQDMQLIETNMNGSLAISQNWVGLTLNNKLHFNCRENDNYVREIVTLLAKDVDSVQSERFILKSLEQQHRVFTLTLESPDCDSNLILTINEDLSSKEKVIQPLTRAFRLTASEGKIIKMMVTGLVPKEIAYELGISLNTVRSHLRTLYAKMQVRSYNDALTKAIKLIT